jgi:hypothetical protein
LFALSILLTALLREKMGAQLASRSLQFLFLTRQNIHRYHLQPLRLCRSQRQATFSKETKMRKIAGLLGLLMALAISLLAGPLYANESGAVKRTVEVSKYDVAKEVTVEGTIQSIVRKPAPGAIMGAHLMVSTAHGTVDAHIGNYLVGGKYGVPLPAGQSVKLVGMMTTFNHRDVLLVRTMDTGSGTITVRSNHGYLVYPGAKAHLASAPLTGGAR